MGLRIVLVGLVAGLGLSIPSRDQICALGGSARGWMSAQLAEWDGQMPSGETAFVVIPEPTPTPDPVAAPLAETVAAASMPAAETTATVTTTEIDDRTAGLDTPTRPIELAETETVAEPAPEPAPAPAPAL